MYSQFYFIDKKTEVMAMENPAVRACLFLKGGGVLLWCLFFFMAAETKYHTFLISNRNLSWRGDSYCCLKTGSKQRENL